MSFQADLDNIAQKTSKKPDDFMRLAAEKGLFDPLAKITVIADWLKAGFGLGHAMAIFAYRKGKRA